MKFSAVVKGTRAERSVPVPGYEDFVVLVRPLTGLEHEAAYATARERAIAKGVADPKEGDPIYDLAVMACVVAVGCVDPESPEKARVLSFASADEILSEMHPETIVYLHEHHDAWQDECSPYTRAVPDDEMLLKVREVAGQDGHATFMRLSPSTRLHFAISMARQLWLSLAVKSSTGSSSESTSPTSASAPLPSSSP